MLRELSLLCILYLFITLCSLVGSQFAECHDDPGFEPVDGLLQTLQFTWLGALQYINIRNGNPHYFRVPRVVLISKRYVLSTAVDAAEVPDGYALGNIIFGNYERDDRECKITPQSLLQGAECEPAILIMPIADVLVHPDYRHKVNRHSVAVMKLISSIRSNYMLPVCLPIFDNLVDDNGNALTDSLIHVDFSSDVPRDFKEEDKEILTVNVIPRKLCYKYDHQNKTFKHMMEKVVCTTGCGFHSGAPSVIHEHTGHWSLVALSTGGSPCPDPLRVSRPEPPPSHILIHPFMSWITSAITGKPLGYFVKDDPFGYMIPRVFRDDLVHRGWVGHWWMGGHRCFDRGSAAEPLFRFYHEVIFVRPLNMSSTLTYYLEIHAAHYTNIVCCKVNLPYQLTQPAIFDLDQPSVRLFIPTLKVTASYEIQIEAWGYNSTAVNEVE